MRSQFLLLFAALIVATTLTATASGQYLAPTFPPVPVDHSFGGGKAEIEPFSPGLKYFEATATATAVQGGYLIAGTQSKTSSGEGHFSVMALDEAGRLNRSFGTNGGFRLPLDTLTARRIDDSDPVSISMRSDGTILVASLISVVTRKDEREYDRVYGTEDNPLSASHWAIAVVRLTTEGRLDRTFGHRGMTVIRSISPRWVEGADSGVYDVTADGAGRPLVFAWSHQLRRDGKRTQVIYRLKRDGALDRVFGDNGRIASLSRANDNGRMPARIFVGDAGRISTVTSETRRGGHTSWVLRGFTHKGRVDRAFGARGVARKNWVSGKLSLDSIDSGAGYVLAGSSRSRDGSTVGVLERFSPRGRHNGSLATSPKPASGEPFSNVRAFFDRGGYLALIASTTGDGEHAEQHLLCDGGRLLEGNTPRTCRELTLPVGVEGISRARFLLDRGWADKYVGRDEFVVIVDDSPTATRSGHGIGVWRYKVH